MSQRSRAFLLEDEHSDQVLLATLMDDADVSVHAVSAHLSEALMELTANGSSYDVLVIDLNLPDSSGLATLAAVLEACPDIPVLVVTGDEDAAADVVLAGAEDVVLKARISEDLKSAVTKVLQRQRRESGSAQQMRAAGFIAAQSPLAVVSRDGQSFVANESLELLVGRPLGEEGEGVTMLFVPEDRMEVTQAIAAVFDTADGTAWAEARLITHAGIRDQNIILRHVQAGGMCSMTFSGDAAVF